MANAQMSPGQTMAALSLLWLSLVVVIGVDLGTAVGFSALWTWLGIVLAWRQWRVRRSVHSIRSLTREKRAAVLSAIGSDPVRIFLEHELRGHGEAEVGGPI